MSLYTDIRGALQVQLGAVSGIPTIHYETAPDKPTLGTPFVVCSVVPNASRRSTLGKSPNILHEGTFEVELFYPSGKGTASIETMADTIKASFTPDTSLSQGDASLNLRYSERGPILTDTDWIRLNTSISWYAYSKTN